MMYNRLVTFGCSLTYGQALDDRHKESWPAQLGQLMNLPVANHGVPGASTKHIWWNAVNFEFDPNDCLVFLWTHRDRWCMIKTHQIDPLNHWETDHNEKSKIWYKHFHDDFDMSTMYFALVNHANFYLQSKVKKIYNLVATENDQHMPNFNRIKFLQSMISEIREKYPKASDDWHPGPKAMKEYAKQIYTEIQKGT